MEKDQKDLIKKYNEEMHPGHFLKGKDLITLDESELEDFEKWRNRNKTKVMFYWEDKLALAVFPEEKYNNDPKDHSVMCYAPVGQHSWCSQEYIKELSKAAPSQYDRLKTELEDLGYDLIILNEQ